MINIFTIIGTGIAIITCIGSVIYIIDYFKKSKVTVPKIKKIDNFFYTIKGHEPVDLLSYQFGLRPNIPIIDLLYLEFLKKMSLDKQIKKIIIFPTIDKSALTQNKQDLKKFTENIKKIFDVSIDPVIVDPFRKSEITSKELIEASFIDAITHLDSKIFYNKVFDISKKKIQGLQDFNKFHPEKFRVLTLVTHIFKAWEVREYLLDYIQKSENKTMNVGFIFWEAEYDKWGIYNQTSEDERIDELTLLIGKSILTRKKNPIAVFVPAAIGVFDEKAAILQKITTHDKKHISRLIKIVSTILQDNYKEDLKQSTLLKEANDNINSWNASDKEFSIIYTKIKNKLSNNDKKLFNLILKLKSKYKKI